MASITALALTLAGSGLAVGCGGSDEDKPGDDAAAGGDDGGSSVGEDGGETPGDGAAVGDPDAGGPETDSGPVVVEGPPVLDAVSFKQVGRYGNDVRVGVQATTGGKDAVAVKVRVFNGSGGAIAVDADGDGTADGSEVRLALVAPIAAGGTSGESYALLPGLLRSDALLGQAEITLIDAEGVESDMLVATFEAQPPLEAGDPCDPSYVDNRCSGVLGCKDSSAGFVCGEPEAPTIDRIGYLDDSLGGRLLVSVTDPDDDIDAFTVFFYDAERKPVLIDTDGDQAADSDSFTYDADYPGRDGAFFARVDYPADITANVEYVAVTVTDKSDLTVTTPNLIKRAAATLVANGRTCDTRTFSRCADSSVCVPGDTAPDGVCTTKADARSDTCAAAQVLDPGNGVVSVVGTIAAPSLWDATTNCRDNSGRPEALVKLTLSEAARRVVLSTANKTTNFDSVIYLLDGCGGTPKDLWCSDSGSSSGWGDTLTLTNLAAGEYYVVVDSFNVWTSSPAFELTVDAS